MGRVRSRRAVSLRARVALAVVAVLAVAHAVTPPPVQAEPSPLNGSGSTYVALAMQQWVSEAVTAGLRVNYSAVGSPTGLNQFTNSLTDFAGTEADYPSIGAQDPARGYQYIPDVAGAVAIMYNANDTAGRKIDYLNLSRRTIARIFIGDISSWDDPAIAADNKNRVKLPPEPITVLYRSGQSGTTALFYDFIQHTIPDLFPAWAARNGFSTSIRIVDLANGHPEPKFTPHNQGLGDSDLIARETKRTPWTISYDEFGYAIVNQVPVAWVENQAGEYQKPFAANISAALEKAKLRDDLSQELSGVYSNPDPLTYPISAYSYIVTQCSAAPDRPTCRGNYAEGGKSEALAKWLRYIACEGQVSMEQIGYSPLPPNLSQEIANSIARMNGTAPEQLTPENCANPRFRGPLKVVNQKNPLENVTPAEPGGGGGPGAGGPANQTRAQGGGPGGAATTGDTVDPSAAGTTGTTVPGDPSSDNGGGDEVRAAAPIKYERPISTEQSPWPLIALLLIIFVPPLVIISVPLLASLGIMNRKKGASG